MNQIDNYTIEQIPQYRRQFIDYTIRRFFSTYFITKWPIDCVQLLDVISSNNSLSLQVGTVSNVSSSFDAISIYNPESHDYQIILNKNKINYPFKESRDRRLNFTIAHELGHIFLDHLSISDDVKTTDERFIEDLEANEFAGRLLMPQSILLNCNFYSLEAVADFFNVSVSALTTRIHVLRRLDLLTLRKSVVCRQCGNTERSFFSKYCMICGSKWQDNENGILKTYYKGIEVNNNSEALACPNCCDDSGCILSSNCNKCGAVIINTCTNEHNPHCDYHSTGNGRYCEICGSKTEFFKGGYIKPWYEEQPELMSESIAEGSL
ncbi:MAG TPA: ImmA/IrrE family metallo-endopeptidase [Pseudobacteroides sp.]|uniref:ImmA/IrrE family metallo-endopeptidase n=1 Tax=Pseudobacteroides sp. TaxID=1968840 RepID=UPI002F9350F8